VASTNAVGTDTLLNVEGVRGTNNADIYNATGFVGFNEFQGMGGNDTVTGNGNTRISFDNAGGSVSVDLFVGQTNGIGVGTDTITGGVNQVRGSQFSDTVAGTNGNDILDGRGGIDTVSYTHAASAVTVNLATGVASGGGGNDTLLNFENLNGSAFGDTLTGGAIANAINGGDGADIITGGLGADFLTGGTGLDQFRYISLADSAANNGLTRDIITDFNVNDDLLVFDGVGGFTGTFSFVGTFAGSATFAGGGNSSAAAIDFGGGLHLLQIDVDGDGLIGAGDMEITLNNMTASLATSNFLIL
jgi:hypothetical protein